MLCAISGCTAPRWATSRWAMDQPEYAAKYDRPYTEEGRDRIHRLGKQMVDARYIGGRNGWHLGTVYQGESPSSAGGTIGTFSFSETGLIERHIGLSGVGGTSAHDGFVGFNGGLRMQSPSRLAPFAGVGGFAGVNWKYPAIASVAAIILALDASDGDIEIFDDIFDDDDDDDTVHPHNDDPPPPSTPEPDKTRMTHGFAAIYPEIGVHYWLSSNTRVTASGSYWISTEGRDQDSWFVGVNLGFLFGPEAGPPLSPSQRQQSWTPPPHTTGDPNTGFAMSNDQTNNLLGLGGLGVASRPSVSPTPPSDSSPWLEARPSLPTYDSGYNTPLSLPPVD